MDAMKIKLSPGEVLTQLRELQGSFLSERFLGIRGCVARNESGEIAHFFFGIPIVPGGPDEPCIESGGEEAALHDLRQLVERGGHLLQFVPGYGVASPVWRNEIAKASPGECRWGAFLGTGSRLLFVVPHGKNYYFDQVGEVCARAVDDLITAILSPSERGPAKKRGPKGDPKKDDIERLYQKGVKSYYDISTMLDLQDWKPPKGPKRTPYRRVAVVINAFQQRARR